jgi:hypothetical protein
MAALDRKTLKGLILLAMLGGGWLYFSGRLDHLTEAHEQSEMPAEEVTFIRIVQDANRRWNDAPNDIQRESMPNARNKALCNIPMTVSEWTGRVDSIGTYLASDQVSFSVSPVPNITLRTEGDLQNAGSKIQRGTSLFDAVSQLRSGQSVTFSGHFIKGDGTCLNETSLTNNGSMTDPEFEFIFTNVRPSP